MTDYDTTPQEAPDTIKGYQKDLDHAKALNYVKHHDDGSTTQASCFPIRGSWWAHAVDIDADGRNELANRDLGYSDTRADAARTILDFMAENPEGIQPYEKTPLTGTEVGELIAGVHTDFAIYFHNDLQLSPFDVEGNTWKVAAPESGTIEIVNASTFQTATALVDHLDHLADTHGETDAGV